MLQRIFFLLILALTLTNAEAHESFNMLLSKLDEQLPVSKPGSKELLKKLDVIQENNDRYFANELALFDKKLLYSAYYDEESCVDVARTFVEYLNRNKKGKEIAYYIDSLWSGLFCSDMIVSERLAEEFNKYNFESEMNSFLRWDLLNLCGAMLYNLVDKYNIDCESLYRADEEKEYPLGFVELVYLLGRVENMTDTEREKTKVMYEDIFKAINLRGIDVTEIEMFIFDMLCLKLLIKVGDKSEASSYKTYIDRTYIKRDRDSKTKYKKVLDSVYKSNSFREE